MELSELKIEIDKALKLHDDYEVEILVNGNKTSVEDCGIDGGRFIFLIEAKEVETTDCDEYHITYDDDMEYCGICNVYHPDKEECPRCELTNLRKKIEELQND